MTSRRYTPRSFNNLITGARDRSNSTLQPCSKSGRVITKSTSWTDPYQKQQTKKKKKKKKKRKKKKKNRTKKIGIGRTRRIGRKIKNKKDIGNNGEE